MKRYVAWLGGLLAVLLILYASSSWLISVYIKDRLTEFGFTDIELQAGFPGWNQLRLTAISCVLSGPTQKTHMLIPELEVGYKFRQLFAGKIASIHIPTIKLTAQAMPAAVEPVLSGFEIPLAALVSGQWLSELPIEELLIENLIADVTGSASKTYNAHMQISLQDSGLNAEGNITSSIFQPLHFLLDADATGKSNMLIKHDNKDALPVLRWDVGASRLTNDTVGLNGSCDAHLDKMAILLTPWVSATQWANSLQGDMHCVWQVQLPAVWSASHADWQGSADLNIKNLSMHWRSHALPESTLTAKLIAEKQRVTADVRLGTNDNAIVLTGQGDYELAAGNAQATIKLLPVQLSKIQPELSNILKDLPAPLEIKTGQISGDGRLEWKNKLRLRGILQLRKLSGTYGDTNFAGLNAELPLMLDKGIKTSKPARLQMDIVDVGFPVTKMDMQFSLIPQVKSQFPVVNVENFSAYLLGGKASVQPFDFDIDRERNAFTVVLDGISLSELVALEQQEGLTATGILEGRIPIELSGKEIVVTEGTLSAREPGGVIRYSPTAGIAALAESNPGVGLMVKALTNFQYQLLNVNADYQPGGDLLLKVRLEGKNPDWQGGRPVNLNLNLQENIPMLLRSLQLSDEISERVRKHYQKSP